MRPGEAGPLGKVPARGRPVEVQKAADGIGRGRRSPGAAQDVAAPGVQTRAGLHAPVAPQHRRDVVALAALAPRHQVGADPRAQLVVQLVLAQRAAAGQGVLGGLGNLLECVGGREALLGRQPPDLLAELLAELVVVARDQRPSVEREILGRERVDRAAHDVRDDEIAAVDGLVVALPREALQPRREGEQRGVAREVRCGAGCRLGEPARFAAASPERARRKARICSGCTRRSVVPGRRDDARPTGAAGGAPGSSTWSGSGSPLRQRRARGGLRAVRCGVSRTALDGFWRSAQQQWSDLFDRLGEA
jgi:hypothetical protein